MHRRFWSLALWAASALFAHGTFAAPVVVSNISSWDGSSSIGDFGASGFSSWGQFVTAPAGTNRLVDFTFILSDALNGSNTTPVPTRFQAYVAEYDPVSRMIVGPDLYTSAEVTVPLTAGLEFHPYTFTPDIAVEPGEVYLMFLFANNYMLQLPNDSRLRLASRNTDDYAGGAMNFHRSADSDLASLYTSPWFFISGPDLAFSATFDTRAPRVPEPWSALLLVTAGAAGAVFRRRT